jgi:hypothetical protein
MGDEWDVAVGDFLSRAERMKRFGGAEYGGIEPSSSTPNVFVYSDPSRGRAYGYNFDGWTVDGSSFLYTGEGRKGSQLRRDGNRAILEHQDRGRALRLFVADGMVPGTGQKNHRYLGEFAVDANLPYVLDESPDEDGELRTVFVFRLRPVGESLRRAEDQTTAVDIGGGAAAELVPVEAHQAPEFETKGSMPSTAMRRESELVGRYMKALAKAQHPVRRWKVKPPGELRALLTDIFDETTKELYEVKGTATREAVRSAVAQLLDYSRHIPVEVKRLTVLLPLRPSDDLVNFIHACGVGLVYETDINKFSRLDP